MVDVEKAIIPVLVIPLLLIIMVAVFMSSTEDTRFTFENTVTNESTGETADGDNAFSSAYDCKEDSVTAVYNGSSNCATPACYNVTYVDEGTAPCTFVSKATAGAIKISYTAYKDEGYDAFEKVNNLAFQGFNLSSILPFVVVAMTVLGVVIGALVIKA